MKRSLTLIAAFALSVISFAQISWTLTEGGLPNTHGVFSFAIDSNGDLIGGGSDIQPNNTSQPLIVRYNPNQGVWSRVTTTGLPSDFAITELHSTANELIAASFYSGAVFTSTDNGSTWNSTPWPSTSLTLVRLSVNPADGKAYAIGRTSQGYRMLRYDGSQGWSQVASSGVWDDMLSVVDFIYSSHGLVITYYEDVSFDFVTKVSTDQGQTFNNFNSGLPQGYTSSYYENNFGGLFCHHWYYSPSGHKGNLIFEYDASNQQWKATAITVPDSMFNVIDMIEYQGQVFTTLDSTYQDSGVTDTYSTQGSLFIQSHKTPTFKVAPNPASSFIQLNSDHPIDRVTMLDLTGRTVLKEELHGQDQRIAVDAITPGVYLLRVKFESGVDNTQRVVIR